MPHMLRATFLLIGAVPIVILALGVGAIWTVNRPGATALGVAFGLPLAALFGLLAVASLRWRVTLYDTSLLVRGPFRTRVVECSDIDTVRRAGYRAQALLITMRDRRRVWITAAILTRDLERRLLEIARRNRAQTV